MELFATALSNAFDVDPRQASDLQIDRFDGAVRNLAVPEPVLATTCCFRNP